jgi:hypothetical protein
LGRILVLATKEKKMSLQDEFDMVMTRFPGGTTAPSGCYVDPRTLAVTSTTGGTLPATDWWHKIPTATSSGDLTAAASYLNTVLNALSPIAGNYAYVSGSLHTYTSADLMQQKGTGSQSS